MKAKKTVSIVIPNYNGELLLKKNMPSVIKALNSKKNNIIEVIVVDDGSSDGSVELLKKEFKGVTLIKQKENRGFPYTVNNGVRFSKGELVVLLNTDVIPSKNFVYPCLKHFNDDSVFAISFAEDKYGWAKGSFKNGFFEHEVGGRSKKAHHTFWVSGGTGIFRKSMWKELKGFDIELMSPFYWEDVDVSYRAMKRGWKLLWEPKSKVVHEHEGTIGKISGGYKGRVQERNQLLFMWKNFTSKRYIRENIIGIVKRTLRHPGYLRVVIMALLKLPVVLKKRKVEKKDSKVSDESIFAMFK